MNEDTNTCCTRLTSPTLTDKDIFMYKLELFKQYIYHQNKQIDDMSDMHCYYHAYLSYHPFAYFCDKYTV